MLTSTPLGSFSALRDYATQPSAPFAHKQASLEQIALTPSIALTSCSSSSELTSLENSFMQLECERPLVFTLALTLPSVRACSHCMIGWEICLLCSTAAPSPITTNSSRRRTSTSSPKLLSPSNAIGVTPLLTLISKALLTSSSACTALKSRVSLYGT